MSYQTAEVKTQDQKMQAMVNEGLVTKKNMV